MHSQSCFGLYDRTSLMATKMYVVVCVSVPCVCQKKKERERGVLESTDSFGSHWGGGGTVVLPITADLTVIYVPFLWGCVEMCDLSF